MCRPTCSGLKESGNRIGGAAGWLCVALELRRSRLAVAHLPLRGSRGSDSVSTSSIGGVVDELGGTAVVKEDSVRQLRIQSKIEASRLQGTVGKKRRGNRHSGAGLRSVLQKP
ncbi:hypothetical protein NDU88_003526 [Pleurodeles waltl]|uniref:Uncharacterized protein n=1 Tax=Pleurodeles waltl TaxID=8319 RepID=A0AAV7W5M6_PLEWA|nr:hypothetical protein NDU88_003526 [Pleurodeles waltl]